MPISPLAFVVPAVLVTIVVIRSPILRNRRDRAIAAFDFGDAARVALRRKRPELGSAQLELVWTALREYFRICLYGGRRLMPMPSQVVDDAWHAFIVDTPRYTQFCEAAFGSFLHHRPDSSGVKLDLPRRGVEGNPAWQIAR